MPNEPALVLSGAGSRGAYQAGCWKALHEAGVKPGLVVGTSAGAINAAMIVLETPPAEMERWWTKLRTKDLMRVRRDVWRWRGWLGFHDAARLRRLLEGNIDFAALRKAPTPLLVTATDVEAGAEVEFKHTELTPDHLLASAALMPGLPPVRVAGRLHADGGHWNAFPLRHAVERGHRHIVALLHDPWQPHPEPAPHGLVDLLRRASDVTWHSQQAHAMEALQIRTRLVPEDPMHIEPFELQVHAPEPPLSSLILRFDPEDARRLYALGYDQTRKRMGNAPNP
ncbi:MAG: patatin-like phospholipase family protein [bacterium]